MGCSWKTERRQAPAGVFHGLPHLPGAAWLGSFDGELVIFFLMNLEDLYHEESHEQSYSGLTWESNQRKDSFAPFVVPSYAEPSS